MCANAQKGGVVQTLLSKAWQNIFYDSLPAIVLYKACHKTFDIRFYMKISSYFRERDRFIFRVPKGRFLNLRNVAVGWCEPSRGKERSCA
jgi:hypothetical protein